ncbi:MAG: transposase, partial [Thermoproteota archaeon]
MEVVKNYRIPVEAPKDFLAHVRFSNKVHLSISREDRKKLRDELLKDWRFSKHYVDSAINS